MNAVEVAFTIRRTVLVTDPEAVNLFHNWPTRFEDLVSQLADRQRVGIEDELLSWSVEPLYNLPENESDPNADTSGPLHPAA